MKPLSLRISEISNHLQTLASPTYSGKVEEAVAKNDKTALLNICHEANIPRSYRSSIVSMVLSVNPQKYPVEM